MTDNSTDHVITKYKMVITASVAKLILESGVLTEYIYIYIYMIQAAK